MNVLQRLFRRAAFAGTGYAVAGPTPYLAGWRGRLLSLAIAFGWMAKGGPYDMRTLRERITDRSALWHLRRAFL